MTFTPRTHENGGNCCCDYTTDWKPLPPTNPCPKCLEHFRALELRTAASTTLTTTEVARRLGLQLARVDQGYMRVVDADVEKGTGTFEARANGKTVTKSFTFDIVDGTTVVLLSPALRTNISYEEDHMKANCPAPDPYAGDIARLRAAAGLSEHDRVRAAQVAAIEAEAAKITAENDAAFRALADEPSDLGDFKAPDPYAAGLTALREKETHR
jgi:hypothetical protein